MKDQVEREKPAAEVESTHTEAKAQGIATAEAESTLAEAVAQEIERRSMMRSSTVTEKRGVPAQHEHRRQDGWTSTLRWSDDEKKGNERDTTAGERLQNQRPHPPVKIEDQEGAHEVKTGSGCSGGCDLLAGERLPKQRAQEVRVITSAAAKENEEFLDKDAEILRLIEERRSIPKGEKQRLKDLSKHIKNASEKKKNEETARHPKNP